MQKIIKNPHYFDKHTTPYKKYVDTSKGLLSFWVEQEIETIIKCRHISHFTFFYKTTQLIKLLCWFCRWFFCCLFTFHSDGGQGSNWEYKYYKPIPFYYICTLTDWSWSRYNWNIVESGIKHQMLKSSKQILSLFVKI